MLEVAKRAGLMSLLSTMLREIFSTLIVTRRTVRRFSDLE